MGKKQKLSIRVGTRRAESVDWRPLAAAAVRADQRNMKNTKKEHNKIYLST